MVVLVGVGGPAGRIETTMIVGSFLCVAEDGGETRGEESSWRMAMRRSSLALAMPVNVGVDDIQHVVAAVVGHCQYNAN
jgi:hypothetical protein